MDYCVITFSSTHGAMSAQKALEKVAPIAIMPVLREISKGCGISIRLAPEDLPPVRGALAQTELTAEEYAFYGITGRGDSLSAERLVG